jgi:hydrogenase assembly chaperone HypC/HupF
MCLAIPAQIVEMIDPEGSLAKAEISGVRRSVSIALCPEVEVGDWVLVHVGFALADRRGTGARDARCCSSRWARPTSRSCARSRRASPT